MDLGNGCYTFQYGVGMDTYYSTLESLWTDHAGVYVDDDKLFIWRPGCEAWAAANGDKVRKIVQDYCTNH